MKTENRTILILSAAVLILALFVSSSGCLRAAGEGSASAETSPDTEVQSEETVEARKTFEEIISAYENSLAQENPSENSAEGGSSPEASVSAVKEA